MTYLLVWYLMIGVVFGIRIYKDSEPEDQVDLYYRLVILVGAILWMPLMVIMFVVNHLKKIKREAE